MATCGGTWDDAGYHKQHPLSGWWETVDERARAPSTASLRRSSSTWSPPHQGHRGDRVRGTAHGVGEDRRHRRPAWFAHHAAAL